MDSQYFKLGVDVKKKGIEAFENSINNLYPGAFCVISKDPHKSEYGLVLHSDSAGSKPVQSYLNWRESGDISSFFGLAQDVVAMNVNDIICVGASPVNFVDYIAVNPFKVPKELLLETLSSGFKECFGLLKSQGVDIQFSGGETADLPDQLKTLDISGTVMGYVDLNKVVSGQKISPGNVIVGLRSGGKTRYEEKENSGIMCNGITLARHCLIKDDYARKYPEISQSSDVKYTGRYRIDQYHEKLKMTIGEAIISPTRNYSPIICKILDNYGEYVTGLVHNTGGGQTKCLRIGHGINYLKDRPLKVDPIFHLIKKESGEDWANMFESFNMGTGFEIIVEKEVAEDILDIPHSFGCEAEIIGRCEKSQKENRLTIITSFGSYLYP